MKNTTGTKWAETALVYFITARPEGTDTAIQRGFIFSADGPIELGTEYLTPEALRTPVGDLWAERLQRAGWSLVGPVQAEGATGFRATVGRPA